MAELKKILDDVDKRSKRCNSPSRISDCVNCPWSGDVFLRECKECCDSLRSEDKEKCEEECEKARKHRKPPGPT
jgi:hypothetical protein